MMMPKNCDEECEGYSLQDFLICTTIHKARQTSVPQGSTFVRVTFNGQSKQTKSYKDSESPNFNEYFVFELRCTLSELLRQSILYEFRRKTSCAKSVTMSEMVIDMQNVWNQPGRAFFKKWGRLEIPIGVTTRNNLRGRCLGYLQIDLAIVTQVMKNNEMIFYLPSIREGDTVKFSCDTDNIQENLLQDINKDRVRCNIKYSMFLYRGVLVKRGDYILQGKTSIARNTTMATWNQEIVFIWVYPSLAQTFIIELLTHDTCRWKCIADYELHFDEIAFNSKPTLGPTFIHFYNINNPKEYVGRILLELKSECVRDETVREITVLPADPLVEKNWFVEGNWSVELLTLSGYFMHCNVNYSKIIMRMAEWHSDTVDCQLLPLKISNKRTNALKYFYKVEPYKSIYFKSSLPNYLEKYDADFFIQEFIECLHESLDIFRTYQLQYSEELGRQVKCLCSLCTALANRIKEGIDKNRLQYHISTEKTLWDNNRYEFLLKYFTKLYERIKRNCHSLKGVQLEFAESIMEDVVFDLNRLLADLNGLLQSIRIQDDWPDLNIIWLVNGKEAGICRINSKYFVDVVPTADVERKMNCWRTRCFIFKDIHCNHNCFNCGCIVGIIYGCLGIVGESCRNNFKSTISPFWNELDPYYWSPQITTSVYTCRIFIHQAKIRPSPEISGTCEAFVRVVFFDEACDTEAGPNTLSPVWNVVVSMQNMKLPGAYNWYRENPPLIAVELYNVHRSAVTNYLGCGICPIAVLPPRLIYDEVQNSGSLKKTIEDLRQKLTTDATNSKFISIKDTSPPFLKWVPISLNGGVRGEILMSAELVDSTGTGEGIVETYPGIPSVIVPVMHNFVLEVVFVGFRHFNAPNSDRHRIKVMMGELCLKSGVTTARLKKSMNFYLMYASGIVSLPSQLQYWPAIVVTDYIEVSVDNEKTIGAALITDSRRFINRTRKIKCCPKAEVAAVECDATSNNYEMIPMEENEDCEPLLDRFKKYRPPNICKVGWSFLTDVILKQPKGNLDCIESVFPTIKDVDYSWWKKYYNSVYMDMYRCRRLTKHRLTIYCNELEKQPEFSHFQDWAVPVRMLRGIKYKKNMVPMEESYATLKIRIKLTRCYCPKEFGSPDDRSLLRPLTGLLNSKYQQEIQQLAELKKITARIYIVQCLNLASQDRYNRTDAYIKCTLGSQTVSNQAQYVPNKSNPVFGKCFEMEALLPRDHILEVSVFNKNKCCDTIIGSTTIDIEDRWHSRHRASVGIAREYSSKGYNIWRDSLLPSEVLRLFCQKYDLNPPAFSKSNIIVDDIVFTDQTELALDEDLKERLSLTALKNLEVLPSIGFSIVPEHVETRTLYRPNLPGIPQGKIQLWVDLFEGNMQLPPPIDIKPVTPLIYELRCVIYNVKDAIIKEDNILGSKKSDLFVKGWMGDPSNSQSTDTHFGTMNGDASFNWRFRFPMRYSLKDDMMTVKRKISETKEDETKHPPTISLQLFDKASAGSTKYIGMIVINLSHMPEPVPNPSEVRSYDEMFESRKSVNLFAKRVVRGWFPLHAPDGFYRCQADPTPVVGKIEIMLSIHSEAEALKCQAGLGRSGPNELPLPDRPENSFNLFVHPISALKKTLLPPFKKYVLVTAVVVLVLWCLLLFFSKLPFFFDSF